MKEVEIQETLKYNRFNFVEEWKEFGVQNNFKKVDADDLDSCPYCSSESVNPIFNYIFYSHLIRLKICNKCNLYFADKHINQKLTDEHFEFAYKDEQYFKQRRGEIFNELIKNYVLKLPLNSHVIDIGGATGILAKMIKSVRPDLNITITDISKKACEYAKSLGGFNVQNLSLSEINPNEQKYDLVLCIDVLYYEKNLKKALDVLSKVTNSNGTVVLRIPNKIWGLKLFNPKYKSDHFEKDRKYDPLFFNPEHRYVFTKKFLKFVFPDNKILFTSSPILVNPKFKILCRLINYTINLLNRLFGVIVSPSALFIIRK